MIYLILPKDDPKEPERKLWGFGHDEVLVVASASDGWQRYTKSDLVKALASEGRSRLPANAVACYNDDPVQGSKKKFRDYVCQLTGDARRVFRHFGSFNLDALNSFHMAELMEESDNLYWKEPNVMPYSIKGGSGEIFRWLPKLVQVREHFLKPAITKQEVAELISLLNEAWELAEEVYVAQKPMRKMLEALFPLYVTLQSRVASQDVEAAVDATMALLQHDEFKPVLVGLRAIAGKTLRPGTKIPTVLNLPVSADSSELFLQWFKDLAKAYTELIGLCERDVVEIPKGSEQSV